MRYMMLQRSQTVMIQYNCYQYSKTTIGKLLFSMILRLKLFINYNVLTSSILEKC